MRSCFYAFDRWIISYILKASSFIALLIWCLLFKNCASCIFKSFCSNNAQIPTTQGHSWTPVFTSCIWLTQAMLVSKTKVSSTRKLPLYTDVMSSSEAMQSCCWLFTPLDTLHVASSSMFSQMPDETPAENKVLREKLF